MEPLKIALIGDAPPPPPQAEAPADYRGEAPNRNGFVVAWPPQRYWKSASELDLTSEKPLHLYFHIPYCLQRCRYCFYKIEILSESSHAERERYVSALCREIELVADAHRLRGRLVRSIYFGGGTPSVIPPEQLARVKRTIEQCFRLEDPEFVFEIEPITLNNRMIDGLANLGVNRISFGIQSFDDRVVALTGRHDTDEKNSRAIERALETGAVVNIDLLAGLEGETMESWQHSINRAVALGVHAVTVYKMELYSNAHYMSEIRQGKLSLPSEEQEMEFARWGLDRLRDNGYSPSTYFTFTREGKYPQHHIISRWRGEDLYGFGASAFGTVAGHARQNVSEIDAYLERVESGRIPTQRVLELSSADHMMRDLVMGLKTTVIDLDDYRRRHGLRLDHVLADDIAHLSREGLVAVEDGRLRLTDEGIIYGDYSGRYLGAGLRRVFTGDAKPLRA